MMRRLALILTLVIIHALSNVHAAKADSEPDRQSIDPVIAQLLGRIAGNFAVQNYEYKVFPDNSGGSGRVSIEGVAVQSVDLYEQVSNSPWLASRMSALGVPPDAVSEVFRGATLARNMPDEFKKSSLAGQKNPFSYELKYLEKIGRFEFSVLSGSVPDRRGQVTLGEISARAEAYISGSIEADGLISAVSSYLAEREKFIIKISDYLSGATLLAEDLAIDSQGGGQTLSSLEAVMICNSGGIRKVDFSEYKALCRARFSKKLSGQAKHLAGLEEEMTLSIGFNFGDGTNSTVTLSAPNFEQRRFFGETIDYDWKGDMFETRGRVIRRIDANTAPLPLPESSQVLDTKSVGIANGNYTLSNTEWTEIDWPYLTCPRIFPFEGVEIKGDEDRHKARLRSLSGTQTVEIRTLNDGDSWRGYTCGN